MTLNFDLLEPVPPTTRTQTLLERCNTKWFNVSWYGLFLYTFIACLNYIIGYYLIYRAMGWQVPVHNTVRVFGDIVTVGWFALAFVSLPWHEWEKYTCIGTRNIYGVGRFVAWWFSTLATFFVYGYMGQHTLFQTSLASDLDPEQRNVYVVVFTLIAAIIIYWLAKLCPTRSCRKACNPDMDRKVVFLRIFLLVTSLFVISYAVCSSDKACTYHLHHWWFGFVLVLLSTASLDNWFDYVLQGIFWTFLTESIFHYGLIFGRFFV